MAPITIDNSIIELFSTTDTALASWLYSQGYELVDVDAQKFPSTFFFKNSNSDIESAAREFQAGLANGNIVNFYRSYKKLLSMIKAGRVK